MKIINLPLLEQFKDRHPDASQQIDSWIQEAKDAKWQTPHEVRQKFGSADFLGDGKTCINIKGNKYRLGIRINYKNQVIMIEKIGTHKEYDDWEW